MLNEFVYCPRLFFIEWIQGEFEDSADTIEGRTSHRRVDKQSGELPPPEEMSEEAVEAHSVTLSCDQHGIIAKMDMVQLENGSVIPVDYKKGKKPDVPGGAWLPDRVQNCAQGIILASNDYRCEYGYIYYVGSRRRCRVDFSDELRGITLQKIRECRETVDIGEIPPPLEDDRKCPGCSLSGICLPDEVNNLISDGEEEAEEVRRLYPARDDAIPVYVQEQGAKISKKGEEIEVRRRDEVIGSAKLFEVSSLSVFGNVQVSTQLIRELCRRNIPICYFSTGGWFYGFTQGMSHKNVLLRKRQYAVAMDPEDSLKLAKRFVAGKIKNCRTLLRRNCREKPTASLKELARYSKECENAESAQELLGIEGSAGRIYFMAFPHMFKGERLEFDLECRNKRPPRDPVNSMLSYCYAILSKDSAIALLKTGFDVYLGFYHRPRYGRPSLALDLMEEFRPIVADSVVVGLVNNGEVSMDDFIHRGRAVTLNKGGKKKLIGAYERRMNDLISHPIFGYSISYRRTLEVQARLISRYLNGEISEYPMFCTR